MFSNVYVLRSGEDQKLYVGLTNDLRRRLREHNDGRSSATKARTPFELIYYEALLDRRDAEKRERFFKSGWGRQYVQRVLRNYLRQKFRQDAE